MTTLRERLTDAMQKCERANCDETNLASLCQRCHNRLDAPMRAENARQTRRQRKAVGELF